VSTAAKTVVRTVGTVAAEQTEHILESHESPVSFGTGLST
jgi:hypothetical protein